MKKLYTLVLFVLLLITNGCNPETDTGVTFIGGTSRWVFSNGEISVVFKSGQGIYEVFRNSDQKRIVTGAYLKIDGDSTNEPLRKAEYALSDFVKDGKSGKYLLITSSKEGGNGLGLRFGLLPGTDYLVMDAGIMNRGSQALQVRNISVVTNGSLYEGKELGPDFRMLDGNGGGEDTRVTRNPSLECRNNFLMTWGEPERREVLVAGGLTYTEIEKFVRVQPQNAPEGVQVPLPPGLREVARLDAGRDTAVVRSDLTLRVAQGAPYRWDSGFGRECDDLLYDKEEVILSVSGLDRSSAYVIGITWSDDASSRVQSVAWSDGTGATHVLLAPRKVPAHDAGGAPERILLDLPDAAVEATNLMIHIRNAGGINAVVSDFRICEGKAGVKYHGIGQPMDQTGSTPENLLLNLYASDPVGKRIEPGQSWFPEDAFYLSAGKNNPFEALEQYGSVLQDFQQIDLEYYTFPTVCLWYAQHRLYGDGPSVNDAPGAVAEMDRVVKSGFLKYSPVSIRLVPDAYEENNEQGWWDEKHWQMYGTGKYANPPDGNVDVTPGHYKKPYETTRKWAQAILERGGIPLTYFQTGRRSDDYAEAFPDHMLFNNRAGAITDPDWMIKGKVSYDFTDPGFLAHMKEVYQNLADGGVMGLMYDYPYTGWASHGGMEDKYSTTAAAYRTIFQLARTGLGPDAYLDERNLDHGSDITLGIVSSQRIWGDTDRMSPLMISRGGLRWYKNRRVVSYDMDAKNLLKAQPANRDGVRKLLTLMYTTCGRFLMANSFDRLSSDMLHDLSRIFPYPDSWISARPADAFQTRFPELFVFKFSDDWYQLVTYNPDDTNPAEKTLNLSSPDLFGAVDPGLGSTWYAYEFWDDRLLGEFRGDEEMKLTLRPGEAKMISLHRKETNPQLLSSNRHLMQGLIETKECQWNPSEMEFAGKVNLIEGEELVLTITNFKYAPRMLELAGGEATLVTDADGKLARLVFRSAEAGWKDFAVKFVRK